MKKLLIFFFAVCSCGALHSQPTNPYPLSHRGIIVKYREKPNFRITSSRYETNRITALYQETASKAVNTHPAANTFLLNLSDGISIEDALSYYNSLETVEYAEPDFTGYAASTQPLHLKPDDPLFSRQWSFRNDGSFTPGQAKPGADARLAEAWEITQGSGQIIVAILDSGIKADHPELRNRLWINEKEIPDNHKDDDNNGYVDDVNGWNFVTEEDIVIDVAGHGTHIAGIIGASGNNGIGYAGADWNCRLMVCKVLADDHSGLYSWWARAIYYAVDNGAKIINMSLGGTDSSKTLRNAVEYAYKNNVLVVASMQNQNSNEVNYPAGYEHTLAVGATDPDDTRSKALSGSVSYGSNYGPHIDLVAPGNYIYGLSHTDDENYDVMQSGTSQAAALVSGIASLVWSLDILQPVSEIERTLLSSAEDQVGDTREDTEGWDQFYGYGRINAYKALIKNFNKEIKTDFLLFPNPAPKKIFLSIPFNVGQYFSFTIINSFGKKVLLKNIQVSKQISSIEIDLTDLPVGLYYIQIQMNGQNFKVLKFLHL